MSKAEQTLLLVLELLMHWKTEITKPVRITSPAKATPDYNAAEI